MNDTAKPIVPLDVSTAPYWGRWLWRLWWYQAQGAVGTMDVVVINEDAKNPLEMVLVQNQEPVEAFRTDGPHEPLRDAVGLWARNGVRMTSMSSLRNTSSKPAANFWSRSRIRKRIGS